MIRKIALFSGLILLLSCNSSKKNKEAIAVSKEPIVKEDTIVTEFIETVNPIQQNIFDKIDTTYTIPFSVDSIFIAMVKNYDNNIDSSTLTRDEVEFLTTSLLDYLPETYLSAYLSDFYKLDSLINNKKYADYVNQLNIGMIKTCNAYINGQLKLSDNEKIILWSLNYSTYEACPFTSGTKILGALFYKDEYINTIELGESTGGGDAPMYWSTEIYSLINNQQVTTRLIYLVAEMDEEGNDDYIEYKDTTYHINISNSGFEVNGQIKD